jgi:sugar phosphate isomerase/epimerase
MLDVFHMDHEREDISDSLGAAREVLMHVHFADTVRRAPGDGSLDFVAITRTLRGVGYDRAITVEIKQEPDVLSAARRSAAFLLPLLNAS